MAEGGKMEMMSAGRRHCMPQVARAVDGKHLQDIGKALIEVTAQRAHFRLGSQRMLPRRSNAVKSAGMAEGGGPMRGASGRRRILALLPPQ